MENCLNCLKELTGKWQNKFCSTHCAATFNNKGRKRSLDSKRKVSLTLGGNGKSLEEYKCKVCKKQLTVKSEYCQKHHPNGGLGGTHLWRYEKELTTLLKSKFGILTKEIINGVTFDFCNEMFIIEFTFDSTAGTSNIIKRFTILKDLHRKRVAFVPNKNVGVKRRELLKKLQVIILSSDEYKYLL